MATKKNEETTLNVTALVCIAWLKVIADGEVALGFDVKNKAGKFIQSFIPGLQLTEFGMQLISDTAKKVVSPNGEISLLKKHLTVLAERWNSTASTPQERLSVSGCYATIRELECFEYLLDKHPTMGGNTGLRITCYSK